MRKTLISAGFSLMVCGLAVWLWLSRQQVKVHKQRATSDVDQDGSLHLCLQAKMLSSTSFAS